MAKKNKNNTKRDNANIGIGFTCFCYLYFFLLLPYHAMCCVHLCFMSMSPRVCIAIIRKCTRVWIIIQSNEGRKKKEYHSFGIEWYRRGWCVCVCWAAGSIIRLIMPIGTDGNTTIFYYYMVCWPVHNNILCIVYRFGVDTRAIKMDRIISLGEKKKRLNWMPLRVVAQSALAVACCPRYAAGCSSAMHAHGQIKTK